jgi:hypothetical protein
VKFEAGTTTPEKEKLYKVSPCPATVSRLLTSSTHVPSLFAEATSSGAFWDHHWHNSIPSSNITISETKNQEKHLKSVISLVVKREL